MPRTVNQRFSNRYQVPGLLRAAEPKLRPHHNSDRTTANLNNYMQSYGPTLPRYSLKIFSVVDLLWDFDLTLNFQMISTPLAILTTSLDLSATGIGQPGERPTDHCALPPSYSLGSPIIAQEIRLQKTFTVKERYKVAIVGDVFNIANLIGYGHDLHTVNANPAKRTFAFGQPTLRALRCFGAARTVSNSRCALFSER